MLEEKYNYKKWIKLVPNDLIVEYDIDLCK